MTPTVYLARLLVTVLLIRDGLCPIELRIASSHLPGLSIR